MSPRKAATKRKAPAKRATAAKRSRASTTRRTKAVAKSAVDTRRSKRSRELDEDSQGTRPFWSGTLTFGLVSVPVDLYPAVRSTGASLRMLDEEGAPLQRRYFDPESGSDVSWEQVVRGYELKKTKKGKFVVIEDEELEAIAPEKTRDIDLRRFVPAEQLDPLFFVRTYFLLPGGESVKAYRLLAATMERTGRAGIATFVMRGSEYLTAITAENGVLRAQTLRFSDEVRTPEQVGLTKPKKAPAADVARLKRAIKARAAKSLDEDELEDAWTERLEALVARKEKKGQGVVDLPEEEIADEGGAQVIDLLEVLKRSMAEAAAGERKPAKRAGAKKGARARKRA
jgi:DNA end-binding protein Ku